MGIDPGLASTGIGIIEEQPPRQWKALFHDSVTTTTSQPLPKRLEKIHDLVARGIRTHRPDVVAIESVFFARNVRSAVMMAHGRGAAILAACQSGVEVVEYSPLEIKQSVVGKGRANKYQVGQMIMTLLGLAKPPSSEHEADALACALCHAMRSGSVAAITRKLAASMSTDGDDEYTKRKEILAMSLRRGGRRRR